MSPCTDHGQKGDKNGYGSTTRIRYGKRSRVRLHRAVYLDACGGTWESIKGLVIRHKCDNPRCINPEHLEVGTYADNTQDMMERGRHAGANRYNNPKQVRLNEEQVAEIRRRYRKYSKDCNSYTLAAEFGVSQQLISLIVRS